MHINYELQQNKTLIISCFHGIVVDCKLGFRMIGGVKSTSTEIKNDGLLIFLTALKNKFAGGYERVKFAADVNLGDVGAKWVNPIFLDDSLATILEKPVTTMTLVSANHDVLTHAEQVFQDELVTKSLFANNTTLTLSQKGKLTGVVFNPQIPSPTPSPSLSSSPTRSPSASPAPSPAPIPQTPSSQSSSSSGLGSYIPFSPIHSPASSGDTSPLSSSLSRSYSPSSPISDGGSSPCASPSRDNTNVSERTTEFKKAMSGIKSDGDLDKDHKTGMKP